MSSSSSQILRQRADALRVLARRLESVALQPLVQRCGTDTWVGPSQQYWTDELRSCIRTLDTAATATRAAARRLEHQADQIELFDTASASGSSAVR